MCKTQLRKGSEKDMHITLTGNLGSGKSTVCKLLEKKYGIEIFSTGKMIRKIADDLGISVLEMNELMCKDHKYDKMIDNASATISRENADKSILFDSRLAWNFVEKSFKVFLSVDLDEAASRVYHDTLRGAVETYQSVADAKQQLRARANNEDKRYEELYGIHYFDFHNYNLVLDSSFCAPEIVAAVLMQEAQTCEDHTKTGRLLISPKRLGVTTEATETAPEGAYYPEGEAVLKLVEDAFVVVEGQELVEKAAKEGYPYVAARLQ